GILPSIRDEEAVIRHRRSVAVRAPPGHLELDHAVSPRLWIHADRALLPRLLLPGGCGVDGAPGQARLAGASRGGSRNGRARAMIPAAIVFLYLAVVLYIG